MTRGQYRLRATLALTGTIIGAGIFGVPAMIGAWGVIPATVGFWALAGLALVVHLFLVEAVVGYRPDGRLTAFARHWLGSGAALMAGVALALAVFGSNLAYVILGGEFFHAIAGFFGISHLSVFTWQVLFWVLGAVVVMVGLQWMARIEAFLVWVLVALLLLMCAVFLGRADWGAVLAPPPRFTFEPYGVFLYSLFGYTVIAEMELLVKGNRQDLRTSVVRGTLVSAGLTYAFGVTAWLAGVGVLGRDPATLLLILPPWLAVVLPIAGFLAVVTSFVTTAYDLRSMFRLDYHFPAWLAATVGLGVPILLLFLTDRDFLRTIGLVGSVFTPTVAVFVLFMGRAAMLRAWGAARVFSARWWWQEVVPILASFVLCVGAAVWLLL